MKRPNLLIEGWLPTRELGIESRRESAPIPGQFPKLKTLHVWWARRPLVASAGAVLGSLMPVWTAALAEEFSEHEELATEKSYHGWFLRLLGILGDPIRARQKIDWANAQGVRLQDGGFGYKQAFKNSPSVPDLRLLHDVLKATWGRIPEVLDPTAGGGSIPFEAIRYGLPTHANDLNSIAVSALRAGVELAARYGEELLPDLKEWGDELFERMEVRLADSFQLDDPTQGVVAYIWARTVACPRTGKQVPLAPNWWLPKKKGGVAIRLATERDGIAFDEPEFEIVRGTDIVRRDADVGTITRGVAVSPWDNLTIDGDYIKAEAKAGRMGSLLYAVGVRTEAGKDFRVPTSIDFAAIKAAEAELECLLRTWRDMFSPRQLLVHGTFVEEYRKLIPEVRQEIPDQARADAVLALLALIQGKAVNWNAALSSWDVSRQKIRSVFDRHDFSFKWTFAEFEGARELYGWGVDQIADAYQGIAQLLLPAMEGGLTSVSPDHPVPGPVSATQGNAGDMAWMEDGSVELVCIDPPYYDNVMYAELSDFFYVWEKRTLGQLWPEFFERRTDEQGRGGSSERCPFRVRRAPKEGVGDPRLRAKDDRHIRRMSPGLDGYRVNDCDVYSQEGRGVGHAWSIAA